VRQKLTRRKREREGEGQEKELKKRVEWELVSLWTHLFFSRVSQRE
jgi:hypothetical protein